MRWVLVAAFLVACGSTDPSASNERILIYTRTLGYRHVDAIDAGTRILPDHLAGLELAADITEDPAAFTPDLLARYRAVFFMYTTGDDILDADGKAALEAFVRGGGGFLGLHSATDTEYAWPFYQELVVAHFASHPEIQQATAHLEPHVVTAGLPDPWVATDEWYNFASNPRDTPEVMVLATIDESTYTGGTMGVDHPIIWCHERLGGRMLYSELGHGAERWAEPAFLDHLDASIRWVVRQGLDAP